MSKYFDKKAYAAMVKSESTRRSSESFFSSKEGDNYFGNVTGSLKVVGVEPVPANGNIKAFNVVKFDDGHQMSTSRFFSAKGLRWPVGGNVAKLNYLCSALESGTEIEVQPKQVTSTPMMRRDGTYVGDGGATLQPVDKKDEKGKVIGKEAPAGALMAVTYHFEEQDLPAVQMINFMEEEE